jgi:hypothetical protein
MPSVFIGNCSYHWIMMVHRLWTYSGRYWKVFPAIVLCLCAFITTPKASYSAGQNGIQCTLIAPTLCAFSGQTISLDIAVVNNSSQTLFVLWPVGKRHLLEWGALTVSIEDEKGNRYKYVPVPGPFHPRQRDHYQRLTVGEKISYDFNVCMFRDKHYSHSPCSRIGEYAVSVIYKNNNADYWDAGTNTMMKQSEVWTGKVMCGNRNINVVANE